MRGYVRRFAWVHVAVAGLLLAAVGMALAVTIRGGTPGTATVQSCERIPVSEPQTTPYWSCASAFVDRAGPPRRDYVRISVYRDHSPVAGERIEVVVGAEWWAPRHGVEHADQRTVAVLGIVLVAVGGAIVFGSWAGLRGDFPLRRRVHIVRLLAEPPLILAPPVLVAAVVAAVARAMTDDWRFVAVIAYVASGTAATMAAACVELDPPGAATPPARTLTGTRRRRHGSEG